MHVWSSRTVRLVLAALALASVTLRGPAMAQSGPVVEDFSSEIIGRPPSTFSTPVGFWSIGTIDGSKPVLFEDGTQWQGSNRASFLADQAKALYGERWAEFVEDLSQTSYFPIAVFDPVPDFTDGTITLRYMVIGGDLDQDFGILFNYLPNGDFMALRGDSQENSLLLLKVVLGKSSSLARARNVPTGFAEWHDLQIVTSGTTIAGYMDGRKYLETKLDAPVSGRIGIYSKSDTVAVVDSFSVEATE